jgi:drug/metabolite transporter (DMT)-like permease
VLGGIVAWTRPRWRAPLGMWIAVILFGIGNLALPQWMILWSQRWVDSGMTAVLLAATPLLTLLLAQPFLPNERITAGRLVALVIGLGGVALLMSRSLRLGQGEALTGQLTQLGAAGCFAVTSVLAGRIMGVIDPLAQASVSALASAVFVALLHTAYGFTPALPESTLTWVAVLMLGIGANGIAWALFVRLLSSVGPTQTQMISYLTPLVAVTLGIAVLGEPLRPELAAGGACILGALLLYRRSRSARVVPSAPPSANAPD